LTKVAQHAVAHSRSSFSRETVLRRLRAIRGLVVGQFAVWTGITARRPLFAPSIIGVVDAAIELGGKGPATTDALQMGSGAPFCVYLARLTWRARV
jgi:hypothetical protein